MAIPPPQLTSLDDLNDKLTTLSLNENTVTTVDTPIVPKTDSPYTPSRPYFSVMTIVNKAMMPASSEPSISLAEILKLPNFATPYTYTPPAFTIGATPKPTDLKPSKRRNRKPRAPTTLFPSSEFTFIQPKDGRTVVQLPKDSRSSRGLGVSTKCLERNSKSHPYARPSLPRHTIQNSHLRVIIQDPPVHFKGNTIRPGTPYPKLTLSAIAQEILTE